MRYFVISLVAVFGPLLLWPIELVTPYPSFIEELFFCMLMVIVLNKSRKRIFAMKMAILVGVLFSITETVLYLTNISLVGQPNDIVLRFILTAILHTTTCLIMVVLGSIKRWLIIGGLILATVLHHLFNNSAF